MVVSVDTLNGILEDRVLDFDDILVSIVDDDLSTLVERRVDSCDVGEFDSDVVLVVTVKACFVLLVGMWDDVFGDGELDSDVI